MKRDNLDSRTLHVLSILENGVSVRRSRDCAEWVAGNVFVAAIGINWKVGLHRLHCKKRPEKGLGFRVGRRPIANGSGQWEYRLEVYPINWKDTQVDLDHIQENPPKSKPLPRGQTNLWPMSRGLTNRQTV